MTYAPVIIPTLNRFEHFKRCLESLEMCVGADKTEVYVGLDFPPSEKYVDGWRSIDEYLKKKEVYNGFARLIVRRRIHNLGVGGKHSNFNTLLDEIPRDAWCYIFTEDDNVFSPCFLEYMNTAFELYRTTPNVLSVSGHNHIEFYNQGNCKAYLSKDVCAWGLGLWRYKEQVIAEKFDDNNYFYSALYSYKKAKKIVSTYPVLYSMLDYMVRYGLSFGDVKRTVINILEGCYQLRPSLSLVRNEGNDGSGVNCGINIELCNQMVSDETHFDFTGGVGPFETEANIKALYHQGFDSDNCELKIKTLFYQNTNWLYKLRRRLHIRRRLKNLGFFN